MKSCLPAMGMHEFDAVTLDHTQQPQDTLRARGCRGEIDHSHTDSSEVIKVRTIIGARDDEGILILESVDEIVDVLRAASRTRGDEQVQDVDRSGHPSSSSSLPPRRVLAALPEDRWPVARPRALGTGCGGLA